jgi:lysophospholipid acyltransferase (LPLAT)-like uncharacterized protein
MAVKKGVLYRLALAVAPYLYLGLTKPLFATYREETHGEEHYRNILASGKPCILCMWHYSILYLGQRIKGRDWVVMVSPSSDAEFISRIMIRMGRSTVRGSRTKGGLAALKEMIAVVKGQGKSAAIVADGSQGPALKIQAGVILLASKTGAPILPVAWGADRYWAVNSWDHTALAKPFARVSCCFGEPLTVPEALKSDDLERHRLLLEERMLHLYGQAWGPYHPEGHAPRATGS